MILVLIKRIVRSERGVLSKRKITFGRLTNRQGLSNASMNNAIHTKTDRAVDSR
jgi:hypothetical protein